MTRSDLQSALYLSIVMAETFAFAFWLRFDVSLFEAIGRVG